jgi:glycosyltransferase involved in cell wall biosynthesis
MKFTIGLPITKTQFLEAALVSLESQSFQDYELIIRNNANSPEVKEEIKRMCKSWIDLPNVQYFESESQLKIFENFNKILEYARGEYFMILSDDDEIEPGFLEVFADLIDKNPSKEVFHCRVKIIDENSKLLHFSENCPELESRLDFIHNRVTRFRSLILSDFVVSTKALKDAGGFVTGTSGWGLDEITWLKLGKKGFVYTDRQLLRYRTFVGNLSYNPSNMKKRFKDIEYMEREIEGMIKEDLNPDSLYPLDYMIRLIKKRTQMEKNDVFIHFASTNSFIDVITFYWSNRNHITTKGFVKGFARVTKLIKN